MDGIALPVQSDSALSRFSQANGAVPTSSSGGEQNEESESIVLSPDDTEALINVPWPNRVAEAALYIEDAFEGTTHLRPLNGDMNRLMFLGHLYMKPWIKFVINMQVLLCFFELPGWCARNESCSASLEHGRLTGIWNSGTPFFGTITNTTVFDTSIKYPLFGIPIMPMWAASLTELLLLAIQGLDIGLQMGAQGLSRYFCKGPRLQPWAAVTYVLLLIDTLVRVGIPYPAGYFAPYLRVIMMCVYSPSICRELRLVWRTTVPLVGILVVLASFLLFNAWVGILIFAANIPGSQGGVYFTSLWETGWQLFILLTTANYPDVMMPAYNTARFAVVFFGLFVTLGTFFLVNIVTAVVSNAYNALLEDEIAERAEFCQTNLKRAFVLLDTDQVGSLGRERIEEVFKELNHYKQVITFIDKDRARVLFAALDASRDGEISFSEFEEICVLLSIRVRRIADERSFIGRSCPTIFSSKCVQHVEKMVRSDHFEYFIDLLLLINGVLLVIEDRHILDGSEIDLNASDKKWSSAVEDAFTALFAIEMGLKLLGLGLNRYISQYSNLFDGTITLISIAASIVQAVKPDDGPGGWSARYVLAIRLGRLWRLLGKFAKIRMIVDTFLHMLPAAGKLFQVMFVTMFAFSILGEQLFGGVINFGPQHDKLSQTSFGKADYYANNFNDYASGMVVCFELLVVNNWFVLTEGFASVYPMPVARLYFTAVYVFGVLVCLNIVLAFALDAYDKVGENLEKEKMLIAQLRSPSDAGSKTLEELEEEADRASIAGGREYSQSIVEAQSRLHVWLPSHLQEDKEGHLQRAQMALVNTSPRGFGSSGKRVHDAHPRV